MRRTGAFVIPFLVLALFAWGAASSAAAEQKAGKTMTASGLVKSVAANSVVVTGPGKDWTFMVDTATTVIAKGASTKSREKGGKPKITDVVAAGDRVTVSYHDMGGTLHAAKISVTAKAAKK